jgi:hypothetical protein
MKAALLLWLLGQDDPPGPARDLLNEALQLYRQAVDPAKLHEAYQAFERAIRHKPDSELVYSWIKRSGEDLVFAMINDPDSKIRDLGRRLLNLARPGENFKVDAARIKEMIDALRPESGWHDMRSAHFHLVIYGPFAMQYLLPLLNDASSDVLRSRVMLVLKEIGTPATLALAEGLESERDRFKLLRRNCCVVLGNIGDERAIPALKRCAENPRELPDVRREAHIALAKLTGLPKESDWKKATEYYYELARKYFYSHPEAIHRWDRCRKFWKWDPGTQSLTQRSVPAFAYNEQLCEDALFDLLELDPDYPGAWPLLVMALGSQFIEARQAVRSAEEARALGELSEDALADLKERMTRIERVHVLAEIVGVQYVYEGIQRSLDDGLTSLAQALIDLVRSKARPTDIPPDARTRRK